jgi:hypothetical protein
MDDHTVFLGILGTHDPKIIMLNLATNTTSLETIEQFIKYSLPGILRSQSNKGIMSASKSVIDSCIDHLKKQCESLERNRLLLATHQSVNSVFSTAKAQLDVHPSVAEQPNSSKKKTAVVSTTTKPVKKAAVVKPPAINRTRGATTTTVHKGSSVATIYELARSGNDSDVEFVHEGTSTHGRRTQQSRATGYYAATLATTTTDGQRAIFEKDQSRIAELVVKEIAEKAAFQKTIEDNVRADEQLKAANLKLAFQEGVAAATAEHLPTVVKQSADLALANDKVAVLSKEKDERLAEDARKAQMEAFQNKIDALEKAAVESKLRTANTDAISAFLLSGILKANNNACTTNSSSSN